MRRRGHGEGSIYRRKDGLWVGLVDLGYVDGRRSRKALYAKTRGDVQAKLTATLRERDAGIDIGERRTVGAFLTGWLVGKRPTLRPRTWVRYEQYIRVHVSQSVAALPLAKLRPEHLEAMFRTRLDAGVSAATVGHLRAVLRTALAQAERRGVISRNVAALTGAPRTRRYEIAPLTTEETRSLLGAAAGDRLEALYVLAVTTGLRQGELLALRWSDIDLEGLHLTVRATLQKAGGQLVFAEPKTSRSRRVVELAQTAAEALRRHRVAQATERLRIGAAWNSPELVFATTVGTPIDASNLVNASFRPLLRRAGIRRVRFHDLRHTAATLLLGRGVHPKIVSEMLGHSQIAVTLDTYSHVTPTMQREAVAYLDALLSS